MDLFAYLDPGSASALLAAVLAGVAGIGAALRSYGKNFMDKLMFWKKSEPVTDGISANKAAPANKAADSEQSKDKTPEQ